MAAQQVGRVPVPSSESAHSGGSEEVRSRWFEAIGKEPQLTERIVSLLGCGGGSSVAGCSNSVAEIVKSLRPGGTLDLCLFNVGELWHRFDEATDETLPAPRLQPMPSVRRAASIQAAQSRTCCSVGIATGSGGSGSGRIRISGCCRSLPSSPAS